MPNYYFKTLDGATDGVNTTFKTPAGFPVYAPGAITVWKNGVAGDKSSLESGWVETDPLTGTIDLLSPAAELDVIQAFWADSPFIPPPANQDLEGLIQGALESDGLSGLIELSEELAASVDSGQISASLDGEELFATLVTSETIAGSLEPDSELHGSIEVCT